MKLRYRAQAIADLGRIREDLAGGGEELQNSTVQRLFSIMRHLSDFPAMGREGRVEDTRELVVGSSPYIIVYRVQASEIDIIGVFDARRRR